MILSKSCEITMNGIMRSNTEIHMYSRSKVGIILPHSVALEVLEIFSKMIF